MRFLLVIIFLFPSISLYPQMVNADFEMPGEVCLNQNLSVQNNSTNADTFVWDFCEGDLSLTPETNNIAFVPSSFLPRDIDVVQQGNNWFGFMVVRQSNELYRLSFGTDLSNPAPSVDNLGNINNALSGPEQIEIGSDDSGYYAYILNGTSNNLLRLDFGNDLFSSPDTEVIFNNVGSVNGGMKIVEDQSNYLIFTVYNENKLQILDLGNDHLNIPEVADLQTSEVIPGLSGAGSIDVLKNNGNWFGFITGLSSRSIHRVSFGSDLSNAAFDSQVLTGGSFGTDRPSGIQVLRDQGEFVLSTQLLSGDQQQNYLGPSILNEIQNTITHTNSTPFTGAFGLEVHKFESKFVAISIFSNNRVVESFVYESICGANQAISTETNPQDVRYQLSGTYFVSLTAKGSSNQSDYIVKQVIAGPESAPDVAFTFTGNCVSNAVNFTNTLFDEDFSYTWQFGDGNSSSDPEPEHMYSSPGSYQVTLTADDGSGCANSVSKVIGIYESPNPDFSLPESICSNQPIEIMGTVQEGYAGDVDYTWTLDGEMIGSGMILSYEFTMPGTYDLVLTTSIPGCSSSVSKSASVIEGPNPSFTVDDSCQGSAMQFSNTSTGQIDSYLWDFGNGTTSSLENPAVTFDNDGAYDVSLTITNSAGCVSTYVQSVTVYSLPEVSFTNELACERTATLFRDESTAPNANITAWEWDFGDPDSDNNIASTREATHIYGAAGNYEVTLTVTTNYGCSLSATQQVTVLESPTASFSYDQACIGEPVRFQDNSFPPDGESLTSWAWDLGGTFSSQRNPTTTFEFARDYQVTLVVTASNQCISSETREIIINEEPDVLMGIQQPCSGSPVTFIDLTESPEDPVVAREWDFGGQGLSADSVASYTFVNSGTYQVSLSVFLASGCSFTTTRSVAIDAAPEASFTLDNAFGPPPFSIRAQSTSENAQTIQWLLNDVVIGNASSLEYTLDEMGSYELALVASSAAGCRDTATQIIQVTNPDIDIALSDLEISNIPGSENQVRLTFTARNQGSVDLDKLPVTIILDADYTISQEIDVNLPSDNSPVRITLPVSLNARNPLNICVRIPDEIMGVPDINPENNSACSAEKVVIVYAPYPNPASDLLNLDILATGDEEVRVEIYHSTGVRKFSGTISTGSEGINTWAVDISTWAAGTYIIQAIQPEGRAYYRFVIQR